MPRIACPGCGGVLPLTDAQIGRRIECGRCGHVFTPRDDRRDDRYDDDTDDRDRGDYDDLPPARQASSAGNMAVAGLVLGIVGLVLSVVLIFCCPYAGAPFAVLGVVFGVLGRKSEFRGMAVAGIVTGTIAVTINVLVGFVWAVFLLAS
jgi:predicted Zn finger-like uncharacterized protein